MKTQDYIRISCSNGDLDSIIPFDELVISAVENEILVNKNLLIVEGEVDWNEIANLIPNDHSSCMELTTDEGSIYISREAKEVPEEWYEILSDKLLDAGIRHKVAGTGTIYIKLTDDIGEYKLRLGDHDANGFNFIDIDTDKVEDDFEGFVELVENASIRDDFEDFIYED
jgi:hypothetical protein